MVKLVPPSPIDSSFSSEVRAVLRLGVVRSCDMRVVKLVSLAEDGSLPCLAVELLC